MSPTQRAVVKSKELIAGLWDLGAFCFLELPPRGMALAPLVKPREGADPVESVL